MIAIQGEFDWIICISLMVCSQFRHKSSTCTRYLKLVLGHEFSTAKLDLQLGTHISVDMVKTGSVTQLKIKTVATVDCGSIMCCDIGEIRQRQGRFTSDVHGLSDELLLKVTNHSPERTLR